MQALDTAQRNHPQRAVPRLKQERHRFFWMILGIGASACTAHRTDIMDGGANGRTKCPAPGVTDTCTCSSGRSGTALCGEDGYYTTCVCSALPDAATCGPSDRTRCPTLCPGETSPRAMECHAGAYVCSCSDAGTIEHEGQ
jgi:hypothetical protein